VPPTPIPATQLPGGPDGQHRRGDLFARPGIPPGHAQTRHDPAVLLDRQSAGGGQDRERYDHPELGGQPVRVERGQPALGHWNVPAAAATAWATATAAVGAPGIQSCWTGSPR
jgi:hypothetical protein